MNEVEILNKIMQAFPQGFQGGNVVINIINTSNQQNNNISQSTSILNTNIQTDEIERLKNKDMPEFEEYLAQQRRSHNTTYSYVFSVSDFFSRYDCLDDKHVEEWIQLLKSEKKTPKTINLRLSGLIAFAKFKGIKLNVNKLPVQKKSFVDNVISEEEYYKLLKCLKADNKMKGYWMIRFLGQTGARVSEFVRFEKKNLEDGYIDLDTKCHSRRILIPDRLIEESKEYFAGVQGRWLFPGQKKGQHMTTGGVNSLLKDFAKKYDIREDVMHAHAFRHFFAIQSLNNGVDMSLLKDLLGHGSIDTTQIYTQLSSAEQKKRFNEAVKW